MKETKFAVGFVAADLISNAMQCDALQNEEKYETGRVSMQDVSDCPALNTSLAFTSCEAFYDCEESLCDDINHDFAMEELKRYGSMSYAS